MPRPPDPDNPTVRVRLIFSSGGSGQMGSRLYFNFSGTRPTGPDCVTFGGAVATAVNTHLVGLWAVNFTLDEVDVLDITDDTGRSGSWTGSYAGTRSGTTLPDNCATNVEFDIAERYRGGKPRMYLPPGVSTDLATVSTYNTEFIDLVNADMPLFITEVTGAPWSGASALEHVLLSYYKGHNTSIPPWRGPGYKYPPLYRTPNAVSFPIGGYACKAVIGSQRRRRTATTP